MSKAKRVIVLGYTEISWILYRMGGFLERAVYPGSVAANSDGLSV